MMSNEPVEVKYGVSDWGLIEIKEDVWINPRHIIKVSRVSTSETVIRLLGNESVFLNGSVADAIKKIAKLTMPMLYSLDDINPDPGLVDKMIGRGD